MESLKEDPTGASCSSVVKSYTGTRHFPRGSADARMLKIVGATCAGGESSRGAGRFGTDHPVRIPSGSIRHAARQPARPGHKVARADAAVTSRITPAHRRPDIVRCRWWCEREP
eukprot:3637117-Prymnesium_polylepis.1